MEANTPKKALTSLHKTQQNKIFLENTNDQILIAVEDDIVLHFLTIFWNGSFIWRKVV